MKQFLNFLFFTCSTLLAQSQNPKTNFSCDYKPTSVSSNSNQRLEAAIQNAENGGVFTPKGELRILVITVGFGEPYDSKPLGGWPVGTNTLPDQYKDSKTFYSSATQFNNAETADDRLNLSRFYYSMSMGKFKFLADVYPTRINIDFSNAKNWADLNKKALEKMKQVDPNFDWSKYDKRTNYPSYYSDNSDSEPDSIPDYMVFVYRYGASISPPAGTENWIGAKGGYAAVDGIGGINYNGYSFDGAGFTFGAGEISPFNLFLHEVAHSLYNCPHYTDANGIVGDYYYSQQAWGMMGDGSNPFSSANGYERWYLGWTELKANNVNSDLKSSNDLTNGGIYQLRDFITTGDALRIKIPNGVGVNQYLWLENHKGESVFDKRVWQTNGCWVNNEWESFPNSPRGLVAFYESINDDKADVKSFGALGGPNGIKVLNSTGNRDYTVTQPSTSPCNLWQNVIHDYISGNENSFAGNSKSQGVRLDYNNDNKILVRNFVNNRNENPGSPNNGISNETFSNYKSDGIMDYGSMGVGINFEVSRKIGVGSNPPISNRPTFDDGTNKLSPFYINNISFEVLEKLANGDIKVKVKFDENEIAQNRIWAGNIVLPDVSANANADLVLKESVSLTFTKNGTSDRTTKHPFTNDFTNPSLFELATNSNFVMKPNALLVIEKGTTFVLNSNSTLEISDGATVKIQSSSSLNIKSGANIIIKGSGKLIIDNEGYICIENNATVNLVDLESIIKLNLGYKVGLNPLLYSSSASCTTSPITYSKTGLGNIREYIADNYIQNQSFTSNQYLSGINIFAGTSVTNLKPQGLVLIQTGSNVIFDSSNGVLLDRGFEVQLGATFLAK
ncbi:MAG: 3-coathanger stack domain-containing protein [Cytophagales bacterium]